MKYKLLVPCLCLASIICACKEEDEDNENIGQTSSALTFECQDDVQTVQLSDNSTLSLSCSNFGGCNAETNRCNQLPQYEATSADDSCTTGASQCTSNIQFVCNNNT